MKIKEDYTIEGWKPEEHTDKMIIFHNNEVAPRIRKNLQPPVCENDVHLKESILNPKTGFGHPIWIKDYMSPERESECNKQWEIYWKKYMEFMLLGSDMYKLKACGVFNNIQIREYLDKNIGKLHK